MQCRNYQSSSDGSQSDNSVYVIFIENRKALLQAIKFSHNLLFYHMIANIIAVMIIMNVFIIIIVNDW